MSDEWDCEINVRKIECEGRRLEERCGGFWRFKGVAMAAPNLGRDKWLTQQRAKDLHSSLRRSCFLSLFYF